MNHSSERALLARLKALVFADRDAADILHALEHWLAGYIAELRAQRFARDGLAAGSALARRIDAIDGVLSRIATALSGEQADMKAAESLADLFRDRVLLLVFGKFNAGKSAFCNVLADRFRAAGETTRYFRIENGVAVESDIPFVEGATESTARLQGVRLGEKLVVLDTPGLHSMTGENASLTRRFIESADGLLWLTNSTSPGQVQELDELNRELRRRKPLLPVVTRSDFFDEDEVDGKILKVLRNKSAEDRALQEADVEVRAREKLVAMGVDAGLLEPPVSISAYLARHDGGTPGAMIAAGMERLFCALLGIVDATVSYKDRKRAEILLHHLQENAADAVRRDVYPLLDEAETVAQAALDDFEPLQSRLANAVWRSVVPTLPGLLDAYAETRDSGALYGSLSRSIDAAFLKEASVRLVDYALPEAWISELGVAPVDGEGWHVAEKPEADLAGASGDDVDVRQLYDSLDLLVRNRASHLAKAAVARCGVSVEHLSADIAATRNRLDAREQELNGFARRVRHELA
ncbi:dynamin family protein [Burkholderia paludis]|uniref:dynamin family protein n=1 Tax=Burkholderia paludis TaxID=1506587 RepID=UPI00068AC847|nr:dynamin family protein [Burkholderia paludis]